MIRWAAALCVAAGFSTGLLAGPVEKPAPASRRVALTIDDLPGQVTDGCDVAALQNLNRDLVGSIRRNRIPATGFVIGGRCPEAAPDMQRILSIWLDNGLELGNHTASHLDLNQVSIEVFEGDVLAGETILRPLLASRKKTIRWFRFPMLHTGAEPEKKQTFEVFLRERGYTNVPVTIDNDDYIYAVDYERAIEGRDLPLRRRVADDYVRYIDSTFAFYERLSRDTLGYEPPQILLLHANRLNAEHLDRLAATIRKRGYAFISVEEAMNDPAYRHADTYAGAKGLSWLQRWAITDGKRSPDQPAVPTWIYDLFRNSPAHQSPRTASPSSRRP